MNSHPTTRGGKKAKEKELQQQTLAVGTGFDAPRTVRGLK